MHLCLFEDRSCPNLLPLTYFRAVYELRCGMLTLLQGALAYLRPDAVTLHCRSYLAAYLREQYPEMEINEMTGDVALCLSGRCIVNAGLAKALRKNKVDCAFVANGEIFAARLSGKNLNKFRSLFSEECIELSLFDALPRIEVEATLVQCPWDLVYANATELGNDFGLLTKGGEKVAKKGKIHPSATLVGKRKICVGKKTIVGAGVVLDAEPGPIYIGSGVTIYPNAVIEGPCFIGDGSVIKIGAKIYGNTSIGPVCKVGGEVEHSIFHSYANKQHDGFLGHSYLGMWVNLGAGTTTSNLKNTYGTVKSYVNGSMVDTGRLFLGLTAGDHVKTGINSTLDTGSVIGPSSNIFGSAIPPKYIPAFTWGSAERLLAYDVEKAVSVAVKVMKRRDIDASSAYRELFKHVFALTRDERARFSS